MGSGDGLILLDDFPTNSGGVMPQTPGNGGTEIRISIRENVLFTTVDRARARTPIEMYMSVYALFCVYVLCNCVKDLKQYYWQLINVY